MGKYILALDQGTSSSRAILFNDRDSHLLLRLNVYADLPKAGWVEQNPEEIWSSQLAVARAVVQKAQVAPDQIVAIAITNQRETTVVWDRATGRPVCNAIVWQCRRTAPLCEKLKTEGYEPLVRERTGLVLDAYFSGTKIAWILDDVEGVRARAKGVSWHLAQSNPADLEPDGWTGPRDRCSKRVTDHALRYPEAGVGR